MKSLIFLAPCLAAYAVSAFAQSSAQVPDRQTPDTAKSAAEAQDPEKTSQPKTNSHDRGNATDGDKTRMVGCILGQDGKYILITSKQSSVVKLNSAEDLKSYIEHKVKVVGTNNPAVQSDANNSSASSGTLTVTKLKVISKRCDIDSGKDSEKSWKHILTP